jgi:hypothetical protein
VGEKFKFLIASMNLIRCTSTPDANMLLAAGLLVSVEAKELSKDEIDCRAMKQKDLTPERGKSKLDANEQIFAFGR